MPTICIRFPEGHEIQARVQVQDDTDRVDIALRRCKCGCDRLFAPETRQQRFFNEIHRIGHNNDKRKKTNRRRK